MKKLVITIPAYNEERSISDVLERIPKAIEGIGTIDFVVINDGSIDRTGEIAKTSGADVINHPYNLGLGVAFQNGINRALEKGADIIVNIDADGQFNPEDIPKLVFPILKGEAEFVAASRFISPGLVPKMSKMKTLGNKVMSFIISKIVGRKFLDVSCGFRAYSREAALQMNLFGKFTYTQETFIDLAAKNVAIIEVPVKVLGERQFGKSKVSSNLFKYGFHTLRIIFSSFRDYKPLRLMLSFSLVLILIGIISGGFFLAHYIRVGAFKPHTWAAFLSSSSLVLALFIAIIGVIMEMFSRMRMNQERLLYFARKKHYEGNKSE